MRALLIQTGIIDATVLDGATYTALGSLLMTRCIAGGQAQATGAVPAIAFDVH